MRPFFFGTRDRPLYGVLHGAAGSPGRCVLVCSPIGHEAQHCHWALRDLGDELSRRRLPTLRFDYSGTGDSAGQLQSSSVETWLDDVRLAAQEALDETGATELDVVGLRFGATLAQMALSEGLAPPVRRWLLWEPVSGHEMLGQWRSLQQHFFESSWRTACDETNRDSLLGFSYRRELVSEIEACDVDFGGLNDAVVLRSATDSGCRPPDPAGPVETARDTIEWAREETVTSALLAGRTVRQAVDLLVGTEGPS